MSLTREDPGPVEERDPIDDQQCMGCGATKNLNHKNYCPECWEKVHFINGESPCGCVLDYDSGDGEYSAVHVIDLCDFHRGRKTK